MVVFFFSQLKKFLALVFASDAFNHTVAGVGGFEDQLLNRVDKGSQQFLTDKVSYIYYP